MGDLSSSKVALSMRKGRKGWMMLSFLGAPRCFFFRSFHTVDVWGLFVPSGVEAWFSCVVFCLLCFLPVFFRAIQSKNKPAPTTKIEGVMMKKQHDSVWGWEVILIKRQCLFVSYHPGQTGCGHLPVAGSGKIIFPDQKRAPQWVFRKERNIPLKI